MEAMKALESIFHALLEDLRASLLIFFGLLAVLFAFWFFGPGFLFEKFFDLFYNPLFPFLGPPLLAVVFWYVWVYYRRAEFTRNQKYAVLEIKLPREVSKSPLAMELALAGFHVLGGESTWYDRYVLGKTRPWFSLEIASIEGAIHFFVWTREAFRNVVEASLYSQYPDLEISEVPDYTNAFPYFDYREMSLWGAYLELKKTTKDKKPANPYPIKTYVDYGLHEDPKEEFKVDPLTSVLELMSTVGKGEQVWIQFIIRAHKGPWDKTYGLASDTDIKKEGEAIIKELRESLKSAPVKEGEVTYSRIPTKGEAEMFAAIERKLSKPLFDVGMRLIYVGKPQDYKGVRIPGFANIMKPFYTANMNNINLSGDTTYDFFWQDYNQLRTNLKRKKMLAGYRLRSWFHPPYKKRASVMSSEELATLYHFPGSVAATPTIVRSMAKKGEAPENLPR